MKEVNLLIEIGVVQWNPEFMDTACIPYLRIVYDELQKVVIYDIESTCWVFFEFYNDYKKLRKILLRNNKDDLLFYKEFFNLYVEMDKFVVAGGEIFSTCSKKEHIFSLQSAFYKKK